MPFWSLSTGGSQVTPTVLELMTFAWRFVGSPGTKKIMKKNIKLFAKNPIMKKEKSKIREIKKRGDTARKLKKKIRTKTKQISTF